MSSTGVSTRDVLQDHSQAKVKLYVGYLSTYLKILGNTPFMEAVHLFDVLCGEGKYKDGAEGSALQGLRAIHDYYSSTPQAKLKLKVGLNDSGKSDVEKGYSKIQRVQSNASLITLPQDKVSLKYSEFEYDEMLKEVGATLKKLSFAEKSLVFIDPWGYKSIRPQKLRDLFSCRKCEILLFLPTTHMYRFANVATANIPEERVRKCFRPLKALLEELFDNAVPRFKQFEEFEPALLKRLQEKLGAEYKSSFMLETASHNKYSLFFFTPHIKGLEAFNEVCWKLDKVYGRGHFHYKNPSQLSLILDCPKVALIKQVRDLIKSGDVNNKQVYEFGIVKGHVTSSINAALNHLRENEEVIVEAYDKKPVQRAANYLNHKPKRDVLFKYVG